MASKDSLIRLKKLIIPNKYIIKDLIIAIVFDDIVSFFSYKSLFQKNFSVLEKEKFINFPQITSYENLEKFEKSNNLFQIKSNKLIFKKEDLDESLNLDYLNFSSNNLIKNLVRLNKEFNQETLIKINKKNKKEKVFILKNVSNTNTNIPLEVQLNLEEKSELDPEDVKNFVEFLDIERDDYVITFLKGYDLPRFSKKDFLEKLFNEQGSRDLIKGDICYTIKDFRGTQNINDYVELVSNVLYSDKGIVKEKHFEYFKNGSVCQPKNFKKNDKIGGYFKGGVVELANNFVITQNLDQEREYFKSKLDNYDGNFWIRKKIDAMKKYYRYPRSSLIVLNFRKPLVSNIFNLPDELNNIDYISGFLNTVSGSRSLINTFSINLMSDLYNFVKNNYVSKGLISSSNRAYSKLNNLFSNKKTFTKRIYNIPSKKEMISLLEEITNEQDYEDSIVSFFQDPRIVNYKNLYAVSFFVLCKNRNNCDLISNLSETSTKLKTFKFLQDKIFYDTEYNQYDKR